MAQGIKDQPAEPGAGPGKGQRRPRRGGRRGARRIRRLIAEAVIAAIFLSVVGVKIFSYLNPSVLSTSTVDQQLSAAIDNTKSFFGNLPMLNSCPAGQAMYDVSGGYVCAPAPAASIYTDIYLTYPLNGDGRESIYPDSGQASVPAANDLLRNRYDVPRYPAMQLPGLPTWTENAYNADYWRFEFYGMRPGVNLLQVFEATGNQAYAAKLLALTSSFIAAEPKSALAWADPHAVGFRSMALVEMWWKLRQAHSLPEAASSAILGELEKTGQYLADQNHYQDEDNHAINEAAALYQLAVAFPGLPNAAGWLSLAKQRFAWQLNGLIDSDGQLIENSPFYDFYSLGKYEQVYRYSQQQQVPIAGNFASRLSLMSRFAAYILQPNSQVPLIGASTETTINDSGPFRQLAAEDPQLDYVLTHGSKGTAPPTASVYFPGAQMSVLRSGWGKGAAYADSTYLTFNIGNYRTQHSDLDALGLTLYGDGGDLLPGTGLYTYTPGTYRDYFHGTTAANDVTVDGQTQVQGSGTAGPLTTTDGVTYQSGTSLLYSGVTQQRMVAMVDASHLLVVDRLTSQSVHDYRQAFHLAPGARLSTSGLTVTGTGGDDGPAGRQITISQAVPDGISESSVINQRGAHPAGLCSEQYGALLPCYQVDYSTRGKDAEFVTMLTIGRPAGPAMRVSVSGPASRQSLTVTDGARHLTLTLGESAARPVVATASDPTSPKTHVTVVPATATAADWYATGPGTMHFTQVPQQGDGLVVRLTSSATTQSDLVDDAVQLNLDKDNARLPIEINGEQGISEARLVLSNNRWAVTETVNLLDAVPRTQSDDWTDLFLGPSGQLGTSGGWRASAPGFDWSRIDGMKLVLEVRHSGVPSTISVGALSLVPPQQHGKVSIIFDDGYDSILYAASYMHANGMSGNIAVIGKYVDYPTQDHLNVYQLKQLQNDWGWDMVNHTQQHVDAVTTYADQHNLTGYAADILQQAAWLEANGLDSAPNWFIYPHGDINGEVEAVAARYYMFARVTADNPEAYPYGDQHAISDLEIQYPGDEGESGSSSTTTSPAQIAAAVQQAQAHNMTLILTFHRISAVASDAPGYPLALFKQVVDNLKRSGVQVDTLSQLDASNGVPLTNHITYQPAVPSQLTVAVSGTVGPSAWPGGWDGRKSWLPIAAVLLVLLILLIGALLGFAAWSRRAGRGPSALSTSSVPAPACHDGTGLADTGPDQYDQQVLRLGPVLYLPLDDPGCARAADLSGNGHQAQYHGGKQPLGATALPNGDVATVFNGAGQYVDVPSFAGLSVPAAGCLSVQAWVRPDTLQFSHEEGSGFVYLLGKGTSGKQEYALRMYSAANSEEPPRPNRISAYVYNLSGGLGSGAYFQDPVQPGQWMMVTLVIDARPSADWSAGSVTIYRNGAQAGGPVSLGQFGVTPNAGTAPFRIAARDLDSFFDGAIGKVAVYDKVLTSQDVSDTYETMAAVPAVR